MRRPLVALVAGVLVTACTAGDTSPDDAVEPGPNATAASPADDEARSGTDAGPRDPSGAVAARLVSAGTAAVRYHETEGRWPASEDALEDHGHMTLGPSVSVEFVGTDDALCIQGSLDGQVRHVRPAQDPADTSDGPC